VTVLGSLERGSKARRRLRSGALGAMLLLAIQNVVGIFLNLYVAVTAQESYGGVLPALVGSSAGTIHFLDAIALFVGLIVMLIVGRRTGDWRLTGLNSGALIAFLIAAYSGFHFVYSGENAYSFLMEMGFLGVVLAEAGILAIVGGSATLPPPVGDHPGMASTR